MSDRIPTPRCFDPMEHIIAEALEYNLLVYERGKRNLDFYLPKPDVYIEVKQFHSDRISEQMSRAENVIAIQGVEAAKFFARCLSGDF